VVRIPAPETTDGCMTSELDHSQRERADETGGRWTGLIAPHDQHDMGFGVRPAPFGPSVVVLVVSIAFGAMVLAAAKDRFDLLWLPLCILGGVEVLVGRYRLRTEKWREREWWTRHRVAALLLVGTGAIRDPRHERLGALLQIVLGLATVTGAVLLRLI
jgi:hypothetical protein